MNVSIKNSLCVALMAAISLIPGSGYAKDQTRKPDARVVAKKEMQPVKQPAKQVDTKPTVQPKRGSLAQGPSCPVNIPTTTIYVDPVNGPYYTIQSAIDTFQNSNAGFTQINIAPGVYVENIQIEKTSAGANLQTRNYDLGETIATDELLRGLQIIGDNRPCFPQYQNGYENAANSGISTVYTLETSDPNLGPFPVLIAGGFGAHPTTPTGPLPVQISDPFLGTEPITNDFAGGFAVIGRGAIGFATKTLNAQNAGAGAVLIIDNSPVGTIDMGGTDPTITIPAFSISSAFGAELLAAITADPSITFTVLPPATFYNPPIGTNFALVSLSHPGGDFTKIQVTMGTPLPIVDPNLPRGVAPVLEQPVFDDPRLALVPGDQLILSESDIFGNLGRQVFTVDSLSGNVITLTSAVDPTVVDITKPGSSLTFLPNVNILPACGRQPVFTAQEIGFSMNGIWIDTNPDIPFGQTQFGLLLSGVEADLANIIVTDTQFTSANEPAIDIAAQSFVTINDGWRESTTNRRISSIGWSQGIFVSEASQLTGSIVFVTNAFNGDLFSVDGDSKVIVDDLTLMGAFSLGQPDRFGLSVTNASSLYVSSLLTVTDVFGSGIQANDGEISNTGFDLERIYKPAGGIVEANALQLNGGCVFAVTEPDLYADNGAPTALIRTTSVVEDCFDIDPNGEATSGTIPNVGIFVDDYAQFISYRDLIFNNNSVDYLTVKDSQFITPGWNETPHSIFQITDSGELNSVYNLQEIVGTNVQITLDPSEVFQYNGLYISPTTCGKTFTIFSNNCSSNCLTLTEGSFIGSSKKTLKFLGKGAFVTFKIVSPTEVLVLDKRCVEFSDSCYEPTPARKFRGVVEKDHDHYIIHACWKPSHTKDVQAYNLYKEGELIKTVLSDEKLRVKIRSHSNKHLHDKYTVTAVSSTLYESKPVHLHIEEAVGSSI